jgi:hypothetical protein
MSVGELKRAMDELSVDDRLELAEYLRAGAKRNDPEWQAEIGRRLDRCLAGQSHSRDEVMALHDRLSVPGE